MPADCSASPHPCGSTRKRTWPNSTGCAFCAATSRITPVTSDSISFMIRSEEHTSELQSQSNLVCRLLLEKKKSRHNSIHSGLYSFLVEISLTAMNGHKRFYVWLLPLEIVVVSDVGMQKYVRAPVALRCEKHL